MNPQGAFLFLLGFVIDLYIFLVLTRFLLQLVRADFYNPVSQFVVKATNPILMPLRKIIPGYGGMDIAALVAVVALIVFKLVLVSLLAMGALRFSPLQLLVVTVSEIARLLLDYLFWTIILRIVLSWLAPDPRITELDWASQPLLSTSVGTTDGSHPVSVTGARPLDAAPVSGSIRYTLLALLTPYNRPMTDGSASKRRCHRV